MGGASGPAVSALRDLGEVVEQEGGRGADDEGAGDQVAAAEVVLADEGQGGEDEEPGDGEEASPAGCCGDERGGGEEGDQGEEDFEVAGQVAGEDRLGGERPAVARDHPETQPALAGGDAAPRHLPGDEVEVEEKKARQEGEGDPQASGDRRQGEEGHQRAPEDGHDDQAEVDGEGGEAVADRRHREGDRDPLGGADEVEPRPLDRQRLLHPASRRLPT